MSPHEQPSNLSIPAPSGARIGAFIVDAIAMAILSSLLRALSISTILINVFLISYFIICHATTGQTLGKFIFKLKVVSHKASSAPLPASILSILLRETIGRLAAVIIFFGGYLWIFFDKNARGLHDLIGSTKVINLKLDSKKSGFGRYEKIGIFVSIMVLAVTVGTYILLYTTIPLEAIADKIEEKGGTISGITGSIAKGFNVKELFLANSKGELELKNLSFKYDLITMLTKNELRIGHITLQSGHFKAYRPQKNKDQKVANSNTQHRGTSAMTKAEPEQPVPVQVDYIDINNFSFDSGALEDKAIEVLRLYLADLTVLTKSDSSETDLNFSQLYLDSNQALLNVGKTEYAGNVLTMHQPATGFIKASGYSDILKKDVPVEVFLNGNLQNYNVTGYLRALDRRLQIEFDSTTRRALVHIYGLLPEAYFKTPVVLSNISIRMDEKPRTSRGNGLEQSSLARGKSINTPTSGAFSIRRFPFRSSGPHFTHQRGTQSFKVRVDWISLVFSGFRKKNFIVYVPDGHATREDWLADLYWGKKMSELSAEQQQMIISDATQLEPDELTPEPAQVTLRQPAAAAPRQPEKGQ